MSDTRRALHAWRTHRHTGDSKSDCVGAFGQQTLDLRGGHMPFQRVAGDLTGMARRQRQRNALLGANRGCVFYIVHRCFEASIL